MLGPPRTLGITRLAEALVESGQRVLGVDCLTDYYDVAVKRMNVGRLLAAATFEFSQTHLRTADLDGLIDGADIMFHLAGQPSVRESFAEGFRLYAENNILAAQRLPEAAKRAGTPRFVFASSSSVYGNAPRFPAREADLPRPLSPYRGQPISQRSTSAVSTPPTGACQRSRSATSRCTDPAKGRTWPSTG